MWEGTRDRSLERTVSRQIPNKESKTFIPLRDLFCERSQSAPPPERKSGLLPPGTSLPEKLKISFELLSRLSLDDVRVHYNSDESYTKGKDIYLAHERGEECLAHEVWHVVQQMRGQVKPTIELGGEKRNNDRNLEKEADMMGKLALQLSKDPEHMTRLRSLLETEPSKMSDLYQLKAIPKDVIQMYTVVEDDFAVPDSPSERALRTIMNSLSRNANSALKYYNDDPKTSLRFINRSLAHIDSLACTGHYAYVERDYHDLTDICNPEHPSYPLGLQLRHDTSIVILISLDAQRLAAVLHTQQQPELENAEILSGLTHEITIHAIQALSWLKKLRSGVDRAVQIRAFWRDNLLDEEKEHNTFARGRNRDFNRTAQLVYGNLPEEEKLRYQSAIRRDMRNHYDSLPANMKRWQPDGTDKGPIYPI
jgi:hypothetical protein